MYLLTDWLLTDWSLSLDWKVNEDKPATWPSLTPVNTSRREAGSVSVLAVPQGFQNAWPDKFLDRNQKYRGPSMGGLIRIQHTAQPKSSLDHKTEKAIGTWGSRVIHTICACVIGNLWPNWKKERKRRTRASLGAGRPDKRSILSPWSNPR